MEIAAADLDRLMVLAERLRRPLWERHSAIRAATAPPVADRSENADVQKHEAAGFGNNISPPACLNYRASRQIIDSSPSGMVLIDMTERRCRMHVLVDYLKAHI